MHGQHYKPALCMLSLPSLGPLFDQLTPSNLSLPAQCSHGIQCKWRRVRAGAKDQARYSRAFNRYGVRQGWRVCVVVQRVLWEQGRVIFLWFRRIQTHWCSCWPGPWCCKQVYHSYPLCLFLEIGLPTCPNTFREIVGFVDMQGLVASPAGLMGRVVTEDRQCR